MIRSSSRPISTQTCFHTCKFPPPNFHLSAKFSESEFTHRDFLRSEKKYPAFKGFRNRSNPGGSYKGVGHGDSTTATGPQGWTGPKIIRPSDRIVRSTEHQNHDHRQSGDTRRTLRPYEQGTKSFQDNKTQRVNQRTQLTAPRLSPQKFTRDEFKPPTPSRFTTFDDEPITTRERSIDPRYKKRVDAKNRDRDKNRRFDYQESAILDQELEHEINRKEIRRTKKSRRLEEVQRLTPIFLPQFISVENLASLLDVRVEKFTKQIQDMGFTETNNDYVLNYESAALIAGELGYEAVVDKGDSVDLKPRSAPEDTSTLPVRPPVVTIMGHVDHGKTTLLDWLRKSSIVDSEHGGITQHIGAFSVTMPSGKIITFLDTPGHSAFLSMRERGANVTDIIILVVAADDSVKPQTIEAIKHAKSAGVPMIVAINKIDKEGSDAERVKSDLARYGVDVEDYGGDTQTVCVSGKTGQGMGELEEATITLGEILDYRSELEGNCEGWILEATTKNKGKVATVLVSKGTLKPGDIMVAGKTWTKIRTLTNEYGEEVVSAGPSTPVEIDGWRDQPEAGDIALQAETEDQAKMVVEYRVEKFKRIQQAIDMEIINKSRRRQREKIEAQNAIREDAKARGEDPELAILHADREKVEAPKSQTVSFVIKADVAGSVEAIVDSIAGIGNDEVKSKVVRSAFGAVSESDIDHAAAAGAYILSFNIPTDPNIYQYARARNVTILAHNVIYRLMDEVKAKLSELLPPKITINVTGEAEILQIFNINIRGRVYKPVAGCRVKNGTVTRSSKVRVIRNKDVVFDGALESLKNVKKDVAEMNKGSDCGMSFDGWSGIKEGDHVQCYEVHEERRTL